MDRREYLDALAGLGAVSLLAGCNADDGDATATNDPTATATPTPAVESAPTAEALESWTFAPGGRARASDAEADAADVTFRPADDGVRVEGVLVFPSSCGRPGLESVLYGDGKLRVRIAGAVTANGHEAYGAPSGCDDEIVERYYELRVTFDDGLPDTVVVLEGSSENSSRAGTLEGSSGDPDRVEVDR